MFGDNKGNKKGWNPSEGFSLIFSRIKKFYRTAIYQNTCLHNKSERKNRSAGKCS